MTVSYPEETPEVVKEELINGVDADEYRQSIYPELVDSQNITVESRYSIAAGSTEDVKIIFILNDLVVFAMRCPRSVASAILSSNTKIAIGHESPINIGWLYDLNSDSEDGVIILPPGEHERPNLVFYLSEDGKSSYEILKS